MLSTSAALGVAVLPAPAIAATAPASANTAASRTPTVAAKQTRQQRRAQVAVRFAYKQIGDPYRYGATGPRSWDCSGLAMKSWRKAGVKLPRTTYSIYRGVRKKVSYRGLRPGDLIFFYSGRSHMGIYVGHGYMIHAPSSGKRVQKVKLRGYYKRQFHGAVRPG